METDCFEVMDSVLSMTYNTDNLLDVDTVQLRSLPSQGETDPLALERSSCASVPRYIIFFLVGCNAFPLKQEVLHINAFSSDYLNFLVLLD